MQQDLWECFQDGWVRLHSGSILAGQLVAVVSHALGEPWRTELIFLASCFWRSTSGSHTNSFHADVFVPDRWVGLNVFTKQRGTFIRVHVDHVDAKGT